MNNAIPQMTTGRPRNVTASAPLSGRQKPTAPHRLNPKTLVTG
jgi:hypothetical protein